MTARPLVLDTNVVLDWLVFEDAFMAPLAERVADGRLRVMTHPAAVDELERVLKYRALKLDERRQAQISHRYRQQTTLADLPADFSLVALQLPAGFPRCRDRDDQHFLALAFHTGALLVSRDKAVLELHKRAAKFGLRILDVAQLIEELTGAPLQPVC